MVEQVRAFFFSSIKEGLTLPDEWHDYRLCCKFGWTPEQLDEIEDSRLRLFRRFVDLEAETAMMGPTSSPHG